MGVPFYAVSLLLRSGRLRGRSCNRKVMRHFWVCRFALRPAANAAHSELLRVALSIDHCVAFETAFQTVLVGSRCRNFAIRAWSVIVAVPVLTWWCLQAVFGLRAAFCGSDCRLTIVLCSERRSERFRCDRIVDTLKFGRLSAVRWGFEWVRMVCLDCRG